MHGPDSSNASSNHDPNTASVSDRMQRIMDELRALQQEFQLALHSKGPKIELDRMVDEAHTFELIADLKATLDSLRNLMWAYMELSSRERNDDEAARRLDRATQILELMQTRLKGAGQQSGADSFFSKVDNFVESRLQTHRVIEHKEDD